MVVLDTDLLVAFFRGNELAIEKVKNIEKHGQEICITSITSYELYKGAYLSYNPAKNLAQVRDILSNASVLHFDLEASRISAKIYSFLKKKGNLTNVMDQMIAAITISNRQTLITRNIKHYAHVPELKVENW